MITMIYSLWYPLYILLKRIFTFHTFQIIFFTFSHTQIQILARHGKKWAWTNVVSLFFTYLFSIFPTHISILRGSWGKNGVGSPHFKYIIPIPKSKFRHVLGKNGLESQPAKYSFVFFVSLVCLGTAYANGIWYKYNKYYYKYNILCCLEILDRSNTHTR